MIAYILTKGLLKPLQPYRVFYDCFDSIVHLALSFEALASKSNKLKSQKFNKLVIFSGYVPVSQKNSAFQWRHLVPEGFIKAYLLIYIFATLGI